MKKPTFRVVIVTAALIAASLVWAGPASAWNPFGCKFSTGSLKWKDATSRASYATVAASSVNAWDNSANALLTFQKVTSGANIVVADGNFGYFEGYDGVVQDVDGNDPRVNCSSTGRWTKSVYAWTNRYWADDYSQAKKQSVMVHEVGHALGLGHTSAQSCPNISIMIHETPTRFDICGYNTPRPDDIDGIEVLY